MKHFLLNDDCNGIKDIMLHDIYMLKYILQLCVFKRCLKRNEEYKKPKLENYFYDTNLENFYSMLEEYNVGGSSNFLVQVMDLEEEHKIKKAIELLCSWRAYNKRFYGQSPKYDVFYNPFFLEKTDYYENIPNYEYFCKNFTGDILNKILLSLEQRFLDIHEDDESSEVEIGYDNFTKVEKISKITPDKRWIYLEPAGKYLYFDCSYMYDSIFLEPFKYKYFFKITSMKISEKSKEDVKNFLKNIGYPFKKNYKDYILFLSQTEMIKTVYFKEIFDYENSGTEYCFIYRLLQLFVPSSINQKYFLNHTHIVGRSGSGKSELLKTIIKQVGESCILIDPHGDMADSLDKKENFFKIAPTESRFVINPFDIDDKSIENRELVAEEIIQLLQEIIQDSNVSVLMKTISFPIISTILKLPYADFKMLADCINPISGIEHLERLTPLVDSHLKSLWEDLKTDTYDTTKRSIFNRLQSFLNKHRIINTVCGYDDFNTAIKRVEQGENLVISLPIPQLGEDVSEVLGRFFMCRMQIWAKRRQNLAEKDRKPILLIIDECQNFLSEETARTLDQFGRKFGLYMVLAHQHINQIDGTGLKGSMLANCKNKIVGYCDESTAKPMGSAIGVSYDEFTELKKGHFWGLFEDKKPLKFYARLAKFKTVGETINYAQSQNTEFLDGWKLVQAEMKKTTQNTKKTPKFTAKFDL